MKREVLERPFDKALIKSRQGSFGRELSYVEAKHYIERLNEAFDGQWSFEVTAHDVRTDTGEVVVLGKLTAAGLAKQAFGGSQITKNRQTGEVISLADDLKAAATDALKKAASLFGVGLHLHGEDGATDAQSVPSGAPRGNSNSNGGGNGGNGNGHHPQDPQPALGLNGKGRITTRQLGAVWGLARERQISDQQLRRRCMATWGRQPEMLTKAEASTLIDKLKAAG